MLEEDAKEVQESVEPTFEETAEAVSQETAEESSTSKELRS